MTLETCTKLNVGLNVLRRRPDGYHDIETLFVPYYGFRDILTVEPADELSIDIEMEGGAGWDPMQDLTIKAWRALKADFPNLPEVSVRLVKGAPVGAGLGGGSADAAFMLKALNELGGLNLDDDALAAYASRIGSDCAFFIYCRPMIGRGRGELLEDFDLSLGGRRFRVAIPRDNISGKAVAVSTAEAYGGIVPSEGRTPLRELLSLPVERWRGLVVNDFEAVVCPRHPEISALIESFYNEGAVYASMSGSGSSVLGIF